LSALSSFSYYHLRQERKIATLERTEQGFLTAC
jgi:hypothetical protein